MRFESTRKTILAVALAAIIATAAGAEDKILFHQDFESPEAAAIVITAPQTTLDQPGPESKHCISQAVVSAYNSLRITTDVKAADGMILTFMYKTEVRVGKLRYLGLYLDTADGKKMIATVEPSDFWKMAEVPFEKFRHDAGAKVEDDIKAGDTISMISFYGRGDDATTDQTVYIDDVKLVTK